MVSVIFLAGKRFYIITAPTGNIFGLVITCISVSIPITFEILKFGVITKLLARDPEAIQRT